MRTIGHGPPAKAGRGGRPDPPGVSNFIPGFLHGFQIVLNTKDQGI